MMDLLNPAFVIPGKLKFWNKNKETAEERRKRVALQMDGSMAIEERESTHPSTHNLVRVSVMLALSFKVVASMLIPMEVTKGQRIVRPRSSSISARGS